MYSPSSCSRGDSRRRAFDNIRWRGGNLPIASALLARNSTTAIDSVGGRGNQCLGITIPILQTGSHFDFVGLGLCDFVAAPGGQLPHDAGEAAEFERFALPLAAWGAATV